MTSNRLDRFRTLVERALGLRFDESRFGLLAEVLERRANAAGRTGEEYLASIETGPPMAEVSALAQGLGVAESYFFRNIEQFRAFTEVALPARAKARPGHRLRILSAGCATGEEPYSLVMAACDAGFAGVDVLGVDANGPLLATGAAGVFSSWSLRDTPAAVRQRWFRPEGRGARLDETILRAARLETHNLADEHDDLWRREPFDVVFCRNVIMYFAPDAARRLLARLARALRPDGYLFLGHAETLRGLSTDFHLCHSHDAFYYRRKERCAEAVSSRGPAVPPETDTASWLETIQLASDRIRHLAESTAVAPVASAGRSATGLAEPLDLLRQERYADALAQIEQLPPAASSQPDAVLLRAVLLTQAGRLDEAEAIGRQLLDLDDLNAGAHYVMALCREARGDRAGAVAHDEAAAYLDPQFAMPRLHLGLLARRAGEMAIARREFALAAQLIEREDPSRVLLFGGGFTRATLLAICQSGLAAVEPVP